MRKVMVHIRWAFNFTQWKPSQTEWTYCNQCIQQEERERIKKFYFQKDAKAAMIGRLLIRKAIANSTDISYKDIQLSRTEKGKPYIVNKELGFDFNVSHQGDYAVIGAQIGTVVGTDVMKLEAPRSSGVGKFFDTMSRQFSEEEWKIIKSPDTEIEQLKLFYRLWCLTESYVKALGVGIGFEIQRLNFTLNSLQLHADRPVTDTTLKVDGQDKDDWIFEEHLLDNHCLAVAYQNSKDTSQSTETDTRSRFCVLDYGTLTDNCEPLSEPENVYWNDFNQKPDNPEQSNKTNKIKS